MPETPKSPSELYKMQKDFAETAMVPFLFAKDVDFQLDKYNKDIVKEMVPIKGIAGRKRILNYNQQYWYRLFTVMQEEYPLLAYLHGYREFNHLISDYLTECPSRHYSLNFLSEDLPAFIQNSKKWGSEINIETVRLERIFIKAFDALQLQNDLSIIPLSQEDLAVLRDRGVGFQPSWYLFKENWNLVPLRKLIKQSEDPEKLKEKPKPIKRFWCIYRQQNRLFQEELNRTQYLLLLELNKGVSLIEAFENLESQLNESEVTLLETEVSNWFARWVSLGWFTMPKEK